MIHKFTSFGIASLLALLFAVQALGQEKGAFSVGANAGAQRLYGDSKDPKIGVGFEGNVWYRLLPFADIGLGLGYSQLRFAPPPSVVLPPGTPSFTAKNNMINADMKMNFEVISKGSVRPYIALSAGLLGFEIDGSGSGMKLAGAIGGGGGLKFRLNPKFSLWLGADYRYVTSDRLDNVGDDGTSKDGYVNIRSGVSYTLGSGSSSEGVIAQEDPFYYEVDEPDAAYQDPPAQTSDTYSATEEKNMEEYVRLKSRVDALSSTVDTNESEIEKTRRLLRERKRELESLATRAESTGPKRNITTNSSMSGFSEIYQEALTHYYNKSYEQAQDLFQLLLTQYPNHALSSNCEFWLGSTYFATQRYQDAIDYFNRVVAQRKSLKKDDALFMLGKAYLERNEGERARSFFQRLVAEHPSSEYARQASDYLAGL